MNSVVLFILIFIFISCGGSGSESLISSNSEPSTQSIVSCSDNKPASTECLAPKTGTEYHSGTGTLLDPYILCEADEVQAVKDNPTSVFKVGSDIDLSSIANFIPIGGCSGDYTCGNGADDPFTGSFDGDGYCIQSLNIDTDKNRVGFFGYVETNAVITNIKFQNASIKVEKSGSDLREIGGVVGRVYDSSRSSNISIAGIDFHGNIQATQNGNFRTRNIGGLLGYVGYADISNLYLKRDTSVTVGSGSGLTSIIGGVFGFGYQVKTSGLMKSQGVIAVENEGGSVEMISGITGYNYSSLGLAGYHLGSYSSININKTGNQNINYVSGWGYIAASKIVKSYSKGNINIVTDGSVEKVALGAVYHSGIYDSYVSGGSINVVSSSNSEIGFMNTNALSLDLERNFVANSIMNLNGSSHYIGSFSGYMGTSSSIRDSFVLDSPIPSYIGAHSGSFVGRISNLGSLTNNFTSGDITETGTLNGNSAPGSIVASDVLGNDTHAVFSNWDFATVWEVVPGGLPKLRD